LGATGLVFSIERFAVHDGPGIRVAVFLKGCPLRCLWCHSPESQASEPELLINSDRCIVCGTCQPTCEHDAIVPTGDAFDTIRERCDTCGLCVEACPSGARSIAGRWIDVPALMHEIQKDRIFVDRSSGGVTFSGGEPLMQPRFVAEALATCQAAGLHTAIETSGYASAFAIDVAARADLLLFDLKLYDEERHRRATGVSNRAILRNFARLAARRRATMRVRIPLVPGVNDDAENLDALGRVIAAAGVTAVDVLPYHTAGIAKYHRLNRPYRLPDVMPPSAEVLAGARRRLARNGLTVQVGG
jgi:pyruvate formate lyase activating enzyme